MSSSLVRVALRAIGVVLPGAGVLVLVALRGGAPDGDFGQFLGAMALSLLASALWAALDSLHARLGTVLIRWIVVALGVGGGLALATDLMDPCCTAGESVSLALFYAMPLMFAAVLGVAVGVGVGAVRDRLRRRSEGNAAADGGHPDLP